MGNRVSPYVRRMVGLSAAAVSLALSGEDSKLDLREIARTAKGSRLQALQHVVGPGRDDPDVMWRSLVSAGAAGDAGDIHSFLDGLPGPHGIAGSRSSQRARF